MADRQQHKTTSRADKGLGRMIVLSVVLHLGAIVALVMAGVHRPVGPQPLQAVTVSLIDPSALGDGILPGPGSPKNVTAPVQKRPVPPSAPQIQTSPPPPPVKEIPAEKVKKIPAPPKPAKPEPKKEVVKIPDQKKPKEAKKKTEKKAQKPKPKKVEAKPKKKPEKKVEKKKAEKPETKQTKQARKPKKPDQKKQAKKPEPTPKKPVQKVSDTERDEQLVAAAIERIRQKVKDTSSPSERGSSGPGASGNASGNASGGGGGSGVQGLAFLMYTQQVKQRVKESWIVTQKNTGLTAAVEFNVRPDGEIVAVALAQSSGNNSFDQSALRAVHHANPLPPPPPQYQQEFLSQKVKVAFGK